MLTVTSQSHVICTPSAAAVIKTYSPNLMVHPLMRQSPAAYQVGPPPSSTSSSFKDPDADPEYISARIIELLARLHVLVVGPGLGRDPLMQATAARVIRAARDRDMPVVLDADALQLVQRDPGLVRGYDGAVLTPNVVEFERLCQALGVSNSVGSGEASEDRKETVRVEALAKTLGGVTVIQKGAKDYISNGTTTLTSDLEGGKKRSGGQGDTLTGAVATLLGWRKAYLDGLWEIPGEKLAASELVGLAAFGGSVVTRVSFPACVLHGSRTRFHYLLS